MSEKTKEALIIELAETLSDTQLKLFLIMLIERQFQVYKKYAVGKEWNFTNKFNKIIEDCWNFVINGTKYDYITKLENSHNYFEDYEEWEDECAMHSPNYLIENYDYMKSIEVLSCVVKYIYCLYPTMAESRPCDGTATYNLDFLFDFFYHLDEETDDEETYFEEHELVCLEFEREKRDIEYLKTETDIQKIYQRYHFDLQESILEDYWFDESSAKTENQKNDTTENKEEIAISEEDKKDLEEKIAESCYKHGCLYTELGRYREAIQLFTKVIDLQPNNVEAYNGRAFASMRLEEYQKAIDDLNKAVTLNPNYEKIYHNLGVIYNKLGEYEKSIFYYNKQIALSPNDETAYFGISNNYAALEEHQKSVYNLTKAIALNPDYADAYYNRADSYDELEEYEKVIDDLTKAIALKLNFVEAYCNRGATYNKLGEYEKAISDFDKAEKINPTIMQIYYNRGESYYALAEYEKAISDFSKVIAHDPNDKEAYLNRAKAYHAIGETEKAIADENIVKKLQ